MSRRWSVLAVVLLSTFACKSKPAESEIGLNRDPGDLVRLDLGRRATEELVGYYFGGMIDPPADPFRRGLVVRNSGAFFLDMDSLASANSWAADQLSSDLKGRASIDWDQLSEFIERTHAHIRRQPPTADDLYEETGFDPSPSATRNRESNADWVTVEVTGVMSTMRRRVSVERTHLVDALEHYAERGDRIIYPTGTTFIAQHVENDAVREITVMRKRTDGLWDYYAYGSDGLPIRETAARPRPLRVPIQCVGCHFGSKLYEPEKSFPAAAPSGPYGPRTLYVPEQDRDPDVVRFFDEHRKRSDHVLGLYATIFVSRLRNERSRGELDPDTAIILNGLDL